MRHSTRRCDRIRRKLFSRSIRMNLGPHHSKDGFQIPQAESVPKTGTWSQAARKILEERYLLKQGNEIIETPDQMCWRVAWNIASSEEKWADAEEIERVASLFYSMMAEKKFLPNS